VTFEIEIGGRLRMVSVEALPGAGRAGGRLRLMIHDRDAGRGAMPSVHEVDVTCTDLGLSLLYGDGRSVDAALTEQRGGEYLVQLATADLTVSVDGRRFRRGAGHTTASGPQRVTAPMPGRIVRVLVAPGDDVAAGQGLVVIEAMKMENQLTALTAGIVRELRVADGAPVESGQVLVVID
jgi:biotin carboxyl carrier protein